MTPAGRLWRTTIALLFAGTFAAETSAQVAYEVVADLATLGAGRPAGGVVKGADGALYGTAAGGAANCGLIYRLDGAGALRTLHEFDGVDGCGPRGELVLGPDDSLYGATFEGGDADPERSRGTIYKIATDGTFTVLYRFLQPDTLPPQPFLIVSGPSGLVLAADGNFYGATASSDVFRISPEGSFALVEQFAADQEPQSMESALIAGPDGNLYGTAPALLTGFQTAGGVYRVTLAGATDLVHRFTLFRPPPGISCCPEGSTPLGELALGADGALYGATSDRGPIPTTSRDEGDRGTLFRLLPDGTLRAIHAFSAGADRTFIGGARPVAGLTAASDGYIYGTASEGGTGGTGTIFRFRPDGAFTTLRSFGQDGSMPASGRLLELTPGVLYGTAAMASGGVVYRLAVRDALLAEDLSVATDEDQPVNGQLATVGTGGAAITFTLLSTGQRGVATLVDAATGVFTYTPAPNANGSDAFTYVISDGTRTSNVATVIVRIAPDQPVAIDASFTTTVDVPINGTLTAGDPDDGPLTFVLQDRPVNGVVTLTNSSMGTFTYVPNAGAVGADAFTFFIYDGVVTGNVATVSITIAAAPVSIALVAPRGGEKLFLQVPVTIRWTAVGASSIDIELSRDGGRTFAPVPQCSGLPGTQNGCTWTPTGPPTAMARIRVVGHDATGGRASDVSTRNIAIAAGQPRLALIWPLSPVRVQIGRTQEILWLHNLGIGSFMKVELSRDDGATWEVIAPSAANQTALVGGLSWLAAGPITSRARLRVTSLLTGVSDVSNRAFSIVGPVPAPTLSGALLPGGQP